MNKIYLILILPFFGFINGFDCATSFSCKPVKSHVSQGYSLALNLDSGNADNYEFELFDLTTGDFVEKTRMYFAPGVEKEVFRGVNPSTYTIYYSSSQCDQKKSISGKGIILQ